MDNPTQQVMIRTMANGIADGGNGLDSFDDQADWRTTLIAFHPPGGERVFLEWLLNELSRDVNMIQTALRLNFSNGRIVATDNTLHPPKPRLSAEIIDKDSLLFRKVEPQPRSIRPWDVRRAAHRNVFSGGFGSTYGHRSFFGCIRKGVTDRDGASIPWYEWLEAPRAFQVAHVRRLMESHRFLTHIPAHLLIVDAENRCATCDGNGSSAMAHLPSAESLTVGREKVRRVKAHAWWFNPRDGTTQQIGEFPHKGQREFLPPLIGKEQRLGASVRWRGTLK